MSNHAMADRLGPGRPTCSFRHDTSGYITSASRATSPTGTVNAYCQRISNVALFYASATNEKARALLLQRMQEYRGTEHLQGAIERLYVAVLGDGEHSLARQHQPSRLALALLNQWSDVELDEIDAVGPQNLRTLFAALGKTIDASLVSRYARV